MRRAILALTLAVGLALPAAAAASGAPTIIHSWRVNLDADPHMEHVQLMLELEPNPGGGAAPIREHWLRIVDRVGGRTVRVRISPTLEHLLPRWVRFGDFDDHGRLQIFYHGFDGGAGPVPEFAGIRGWTGRQKRLFWSYAPPYPRLVHDGHHYRYVGASVALENLVNAGTPGVEVHLVQGEARPADPDCCPSRLLVRNYRFAGPARAWELYQTVWKRT